MRRRRERIEERGSRRTEEEERQRGAFVSGEAIVVRGVGGTPNHIGIIV